MKILRHRLHRDDGTAFDFVASPNTSGKVAHKYLVIHYTAGSSAAGAISSLTSPAHKASAHLVIARDGTITQLVPFDRIAWHAGRSRWHGLEGLNRHSLGIELDNAGQLTRQGGQWRAWFGRAYGDDEVMEAVHKHDTAANGWHLYSEAQIAATLKISQLLVARYDLLDVVGHDDIAPDRKRDPGPAFPMESVRAQIMGRQADRPEIFETTANLNIRGGPGIGHEKLGASPLPRGTGLKLISRDKAWCQVDVLDAAGVAEMTGWVHGDYIRPVLAV